MGDELRKPNVPCAIKNAYCAECVDRRLSQYLAFLLKLASNRLFL